MGGFHGYGRGPSGALKTWVQRGLDIDGEAAGDRSGQSVSLSSDGTILAVGAHFNDGASGSTTDNRGHVRVWVWNGTSWGRRGADIDGEAAGDNSGLSVSLSSDGSVLAVGAHINTGGAGHVRVWIWNGTNWVQRGADIDGEGSADTSGYSVSLNSDGTVLAVGANLNDGTSGVDRGHVRVWSWNGASWVRRGADIDGEAAGDQSGQSVSLNSDGTVLAVGGYLNDGTAADSGHVRVWIWNGTSWGRRGADIDGEAVGDQSGYSVSLSSDGTVLAVGAYFNDGNGTDSGHVRVWAWNGTNWVQRGADINGEAAGDYSGYSVSLSSNGSILAVGATRNDGLSGSITDNRGHVRVWSWNGANWVQRGGDIDGEAAGSGSGGISVSLIYDGSVDRTVLAVGAIFNSGGGVNSGHVRVYEYL